MCASDYTSPIHWRYSLFPLSDEAGEINDLELITDTAIYLVDEDNDNGIGAVMHWAHILKSEQTPEGLWPRFVNARTGDMSGRQMTNSPARIMESLAVLLDTTEFDDAIRRSMEAKSRSTTGDPHDSTE